jgi:hypothetical protein
MTKATGSAVAESSDNILTNSMRGTNDTELDFEHPERSLTGCTAETMMPGDVEITVKNR